MDKQPQTIEAACNAQKLRMPQNTIDFWLDKHQLA